MKKIYIPVLVLLFSVSAAFAQSTEDYQKHPGYFNFNKFDFYGGMKPKVAIEVKGPLLKLAAAISSNEDPELGKLLDKLLLVKVDIFGSDKNKLTNIQSIISSASKELKSKKWDQLVSVVEDDERVGIYAKLEEDKFTGIVVMVSESDEAVFVNIVGEIDFEQIGKLAGKFDIPKLDEINNVTKQKKQK